MAGHVKRLLEGHAGEVEVVALVDPSRASIERLVGRQPAVADVPRFEDHRQMLDAVRPDAVEISTPHTLHYQHIVDSFAAGPHVLTEKPMVCEVDHALDVIRRSRELQKVLLVSYQRHFQPLFRYIKDQIDAGELGRGAVHHRPAEPGLVPGHQGQVAQPALPLRRGPAQRLGQPPAGHPALDHRPRRRGGALLPGGFPGRGGHQHGHLPALPQRGPGDALHHRERPWRDVGRHHHLRQKGSIYYRTSGQRGEPARFQQRWFDRQDVLSEPPLPPASDPDTNFIDAIKGRAEVQSPGHCGLRVIELTEAAWRSARTGQVAEVRQAQA